MSYSFIGGSDGPTSIFLAGKTDIGWLNIFGGIIVLLLLMPNIMYSFKFRNQKNFCTNKLMLVLEQLGRYMSMFLMIFNIGIAEFGFPSLQAAMFYFVGNIVLLVAYWSGWLLYLSHRTLSVSLFLAICPTLIFLLSGFTTMHILLIISAFLFGIGHIYITYVNARNFESTNSEKADK